MATRDKNPDPRLSTVLLRSSARRSGSPDIVWNISGGLQRSTDGGKKFHGVDAGGDNHDLWIDPKNHNRLLLGSDMGFDLSNDGGKTWSFFNTIPLRYYRVG